MIRTSITLFAGLALSLSTVASANPWATPALGLGQPKPKVHFFEVEKQHWAYLVMNRLNQWSLLNPDTQRSLNGSTPMSRYEFAVWVASLIPPEQSCAVLNDPKVLEAIVARWIQDRDKANQPGRFPLPPEAQQGCIEMMRALGAEFRDELQSLGFAFRANSCGFLLDQAPYRSSVGHQHQQPYLSISWRR